MCVHAACMCECEWAPWASLQPLLQPATLGMANHRDAAVQVGSMLVGSMLQQRAVNDGVDSVGAERANRFARKPDVVCLCATQASGRAGVVE